MLDAILDAREHLHRHPPPWWGAVRASGLGPRVAGGRLTGEVALTLLVDAKLPSALLPKAHRIPARIHGVPVDVVPPQGDAARVLRGWPVAGPAPAHALNGRTATVVGRYPSGRACAVSAPDAASEGQPVRVGRADGRCVRVGRAAVLELDEPSVSAVVPACSRALAAWLVVHPQAELRSFGAGTGAWRESLLVRMVHPRRTDGSPAGLALVQASRPSLPGDLGACWGLPHLAGVDVLFGTEGAVYGGHVWLDDLRALLVEEGVCAGPTWALEPDEPVRPTRPWAPGAADAR